ncbi:MAG: heme biosynthesis protein HemY [Geminicoccaceae bacterium]
MIRLIVFLIVAVALSWLATWLVDNPGRVSLTWQGTHIETSVVVLLLAVAVIGVLLVILFEILRVVRQAPSRWGRAHRRARTDKGYAALSQGLVAAAAGDAPAAKLLNRRAQKLLQQAPATLLLSAQTAQLEGDEGTARLKFQEMLNHKDTEFLGLRGLLAQAIKEGDRETALKLARRAYLRRPHTPWVLTTLFDLQTQAGMWTEALSTVDDMARHRVIDKATATRRRAILFHQEAAATRAKGRPYAALELMQKAHKRLPSLAPIAVQGAVLAAELNKPRQARKMLEASWRHAPHPEIARGYAGLDGKEQPAERLKQVERLHQQNPEHVASDLALAEHALAARQWSTARSALERVIRKDPTASAWRMLAEVEQAEGDGEKARMCLAKAVDAPPDPAWLCQSTGEVRARWSAFGPDGRFDSLHWGKPPKIVPMLGEERALIIPPPAARPETPAGSRPPATTVAPAASPAREAPRGQVVRVDPKGAARPEPNRAERGKVDAA